MAVVTVTKLHGTIVSYFDGRDQLIPFTGFYVEAQTGWFEVLVDPDQGVDDFFEACQEVARRLFCDHGFTADQVIKLMEDF